MGNVSESVGQLLSQLARRKGKRLQIFLNALPYSCLSKLASFIQPYEKFG